MNNFQGITNKGSNKPILLPDHVKNQMMANLVERPANVSVLPPPGQNHLVMQGKKVNNPPKLKIPTPKVKKVNKLKSKFIDKIR